MSDSQTNSPSVLIEVVVSFSASPKEEVRFLIEACRGDHPDRFGHLKFWKCMLLLIPIILEEDVEMVNVKAIAREIGFSKDHAVRSLDRFAKKGVLHKIGVGSYTCWQLRRDSFPTLYLLFRKRKLTHIVRHWLALNAADNDANTYSVQK